MNRKTPCLLTLPFLFISQSISSQSFNFENGIFPAKPEGNATLSQSDLRWKDGSHALLWEWSSTGSRVVIDQEVPFDMNNFRQGTIFWVYNEQAADDVLRCRFVDGNNTTQYQFDFKLNFTGWRIARVGSVAMSGPKQVRTGLKLVLDAPASLSTGRLFLDRMSFTTDVDYRTANDAQFPKVMNADWMTHWSKLYDWSQVKASSQEPASLTAERQQMLTRVRTELDNAFTKNSSQITAAANYFKSAGIAERNGVLTGRPFVSYDDRNKATGTDMSYEDYGTMLSGLAQDYVFNGSAAARANFLLSVRFGLDQGFAWGSSMGNNSHYGYYSRNIFPALYAMRDVLKAEGLLDEVTQAAIYWSGLYEAHKPFDYTRGGVVDCWNTILPGRIYAAAMQDRDTRAWFELDNLVKWTERSLLPTAGTAGGIKWDGTVFHHAGHYPAYAVGGFNGLGFFFRVINESGFTVSAANRGFLRNALLAMTQYSNHTDWTIGFSGRHPHSGGMSNAAIEAMGYLALHGGIDNPGMTVDRELGNAYLRLQMNNTETRRKLVQEGCTAADNPQGFFVYNHHAAGTYRMGDAMVTVKGYNQQIWSGEIYTSNNRYGRYQGYGALEIFNGGSPVSRLQSGYSEAGWDWNCLPGTTTVMLPNNLLNSPLSGSLLAKSNEKFAGASSLGNAGIFGMKLAEPAYANFTPSHKARKSVFFFGDRMVCLGTGISNTNSNYPTITTLFQQAITDPVRQQIDIDGQTVAAMGVNMNDSGSDMRWLSDLSGNYYRVPAGLQLVVTGKNQRSNHNQTKAETNGDFLLARIDHGKAPSGRGYEYLVALTPDARRIDELKSNRGGISVIQRDTKAHIVRDNESGTTGYVAFDGWSSSTDAYLRRLSAESLVMVRPEQNGKLALSVCCPDLNFGESKEGSNETFNQSRYVLKTVVVAGKWELLNEEDYEGAVTVSSSVKETTINVECSLGLPVDLLLQDPESTSVSSAYETAAPHVVRSGNEIRITGETHEAWLTLPDGRVLHHETETKQERLLTLPAQNGPYLLIISYGDNRRMKRMI